MSLNLAVSLRNYSTQLISQSAAKTLLVAGVACALLPAFEVDVRCNGFLDQYWIS